jgi:4-oxalocrotonate tautomerase
MVLSEGLRKVNQKESAMPLVEIHMLEGRTDEQKKALLAAVTAAVHDSIGAPLESIRVWVQEFTPREYMIGGVLAAERKKQA